MGVSFARLKEQVRSSDEAVKLTIRDAARMMGVTPRYLQMGLQQNRFPFGTAVKFNRWSYYINAQRFVLWMEGRLKEEEG